MPTSIVLGANGYIGRHLVVHLKNNGHKVIPVGSNKKSIDNYKDYQKIDITDFDEVAKLDLNVDYIFNFASITGTLDGFQNFQKYFDVNVLGLLHLLKCLVSCNSNAKIVFPSSRLVYEGKEGVFLNEKSIKQSKTVYAQTKRSCENYLKMYADFYGVNYTVFRICVPYGNNFNQGYSYGTIGFFLSKVKAKESIVLYGKGEPKRTFTHINDICNLIFDVSITDMSNNEIYNIGGDNMSLLEVATLIGERYNRGVDFVEWPTKAKLLESGDTMFNDDKIIKLTNYKYKNSLKNWIETL